MRGKKKTRDVGCERVESGVAEWGGEVGEKGWTVAWVDVNATEKSVAGL
jgi:hypothetical protein